MEITDLAILVLKSFLNLFRISVIILRSGGVFKHSSDVLSYCMTWGVMEELFFSPLFGICGTMWYVSEL